MNKLRLAVPGLFLMMLCMPAFSSCEGDKEDSNATIVNIEKGVATPVWTPESGEPLPTENPTVEPQIITAEEIEAITASQADQIAQPADEKQQLEPEE